MPGKYYERAKRILNRNDYGPSVGFKLEEQFYNLDDRIDAINAELSGNDRFMAIANMIELDARNELSEAKKRTKKVESKLKNAREEKEKYIAEHGNEDPENPIVLAYDKLINDLITAKREANQASNDIVNKNKEQKDIKDAYKETYGKNNMAKEGEYISHYKQSQNITNLMHLYNLAKNANPSRKDEMEGYEQALKERNISLDYAFDLANGKIDVDTDITKKGFEDRVNKISQIDDTFLTQGKEALGVSVINGVQTPNINRVMSVYLQSGLSWKEFIGHIVYSDKDTSVFQEDKEGLTKLDQEISDLENQIKDIKADVETGEFSGKYDDELRKLNDAWNKAAENSENNHQEVGEDGGTKQIKDLFNDMQYDLFEKLSPDVEERIEVDKLLASEAYKSASEEQRDIVRNTVKLFIDQQREIEEKTSDLRKQLEEKQAEYATRSAKVNKIDEMIARAKASFKSECEFGNGKGLKNIYAPLKEFFEKNYPVEVQNNEMAINDDLLKCTSKGMQERFNAIDKAAERFSEYKSRELNKKASHEDILRDKESLLLDVYKNKDKSFDERKLCVKAVLDRKNDLQSNIDGRNFFSKMFSAMVPNSWTEIGRLKNELKALDNTIKSVVSEQDIKDMYEDPLDEPRDLAKAERLKPVFDYVKDVMKDIQANGKVYENINKDIQLMESGVFAKDNKKGLDSLSDNLNIFLIDGKFDKQLDVDAKRDVNARIFNAFESIKNFQEKGIVEIKSVLDELEGPKNTEDLVQNLGDRTINNDKNLSEVNQEKSSQRNLDMNKQTK